MSILILVPFLYKLTSCSTQTTSIASQHASDQLKELGSLNKKEIILILNLLLSLSLWITSPYTKIPEALTAFISLFILISTNVLSWTECLQNYKAWDAFFWLSIMILLSEQLSLFQISQLISSHATNLVKSLVSIPAFQILLLIVFYYYSMYLFASISGHTIAFLPAFFHSCLEISDPSYYKLWIYSLAFSSSLCGCLSNYSSGSSVIYYSIGFFEHKEWLKIGFLVSLIYLLVFGIVGGSWWILILKISD